MKKGDVLFDGKPTSFRLPLDLITRIERLLARFRENPDNIILGFRRSTLIRIALSKGLDQLEKEMGIDE